MGTVQGGTSKRTLPKDVRRKGNGMGAVEGGC